MTYCDWFSQYMTLYKRKIKPKTRESYGRLHQLISPILGEIPLDLISPDDIQRALILVEDRAGSRQAQLAYALIHAALRRAVRSRHLQYNPADAVDRPEHEPLEGRAILGEDWQLLQPVVCSDLAFALLGLAGLRRGEALGLCWGDVDFRAGVLHVRRALVRVSGHLQLQPTKSRAGERDVPIDAQLLVLLRSSFCLDPRRRLISCAPETLARRWKRAQLDAGIAQPYRLHDLRHTYATRLVLAGCNLRVLQYMVGHSSFDLTVQTYAHVGGHEAVCEFNRLAALLH